jgi:hypothetical protein
MLLIGVLNIDAMAGYCPNSKSGKCPGGKKISHKRSDFSAEKRAKFMEDGQKICRKKYGAGSRVARIDYFKWIVYCD